MRKIAAIILGAAEFPHNSALEGSVAFRNSALDFKEYLLSSSGLALPESDILWLFDSDDEVTIIDDRIDAFIRSRQNPDPLQDLIVYYSGHGGFGGPHQSYYLAVRRTRIRNPDLSGLTMACLSRTLRTVSPRARRYLFIDACFAAAAVKEFQSDPIPLVRSQINDSFPEKGTALLCASSARSPALNPANTPHTMFSGALIDVLRRGSADLGPKLSMNDLARLTYDDLTIRYPDRAVRPEIHVPDQPTGSIASLGIFPNPAVPKCDVSGEIPLSPKPIPGTLLIVTWNVPSANIAAIDSLIQTRGHTAKFVEASEGTVDDIRSLAASSDASVLLIGESKPRNQSVQPRAFKDISRACSDESKPRIQSVRPLAFKDGSRVCNDESKPRIQSVQPLEFKDISRVCLDFCAVTQEVAVNCCLLIHDPATPIRSSFIRATMFEDINERSTEVASRIIEWIETVLARPNPHSHGHHSIDLIVDSDVATRVLADKPPPSWRQRSLYAGTPGARAWMRVVRDSEYLGEAGRSKMRAQLRAVLGSMAVRTYVSLGSGEATSDLAVLIQLKTICPSLSYIPVDISEGLLHEAIRRTENHVRVPFGVLGDAEDGMPFIASMVRKRARGPILYAALGNFFGNLDEREFNFASQIRDAMTERDYLLLEVATCSERWTIDADPRGHVDGYSSALRTLIAGGVSRRGFGPVEVIAETFDQWAMFADGDSDVPGAQTIETRYRDDANGHVLVFSNRRYQWAMLLEWLRDVVGLHRVSHSTLELTRSLGIGAAIFSRNVQKHKE